MKYYVLYNPRSDNGAPVEEGVAEESAATQA